MQSDTQFLDALLSTPFETGRTQIFGIHHSGPLRTGPPEGGLISYGTALLPALARGLIWRAGTVGGDVAFCDFCSLILFLSRAPSSFQVLFCRLKGNRAHRSERNVQVDWLLGSVCIRAILSNFFFFPSEGGLSFVPLSQITPIHQITS